MNTTPLSPYKQQNVRYMQAVLGRIMSACPSVSLLLLILHHRRIQPFLFWGSGGGGGLCFTPVSVRSRIIKCWHTQGWWKDHEQEELTVSRKPYEMDAICCSHHWSQYTTTEWSHNFYQSSLYISLLCNIAELCFVAITLQITDDNIN